MSGEAKRSKARTYGIIGAIAGTAAAGIAAAVAAERYVIRKARTDPNDPYGDEPFGELPADRIRTVLTEEGVDIHVETVGTQAMPGEAKGEIPAATVIFVHGYCLDEGTFHFQRRALAASDLPVRAVYYDQPGHGQSGALPTPEYDMDDLAHTLYAVIAQAVPSGPLVLVGHSMGGMTIMAFARLYPELFAERVAGVALLSTSAGGLDQVSFGAPRALARARKVFLPAVGRIASLSPSAVDRLRKMSADIAWLLTRRYGFAAPKPSAALVSYVEKMNTGTTMRTVIGFSRSLLEHNEYDSLAPLRRVPVLVSCGEQDQFTPAEHSRTLAAALGDARLAVIPDAGHVALLEKPDAVTAPLMALLETVVERLKSAPRATSPEPKRRKRWLRKKKEDGI
ncbi:MAG TPA: alpha/beta hydrolase [Stackebrandtia sp.]|jgi:pimeloyl-ACP methyl ester carboxylesterase|uniref:alpha/beta fold hydrolase n=1 Tax=Stackebrandtia sp. TaxID=2023065 RepID=UPI002D2EB2C0|nr:alpha/beta hydrolase [Stackebrandtia sp.]HZE41042.1 alpha/beta hydrolase [Stackebrandtia sp.]